VAMRGVRFMQSRERAEGLRLFLSPKVAKSLGLLGRPGQPKLASHALSEEASRAVAFSLNSVCECAQLGLSVGSLPFRVRI